MFSETAKWEYSIGLTRIDKRHGPPTLDRTALDRFNFPNCFKSRDALQRFYIYNHFFSPILNCCLSLSRARRILGRRRSCACVYALVVCSVKNLYPQRDTCNRVEMSRGYTIERTAAAWFSERNEHTLLRINTCKWNGQCAPLDDRDLCLSLHLFCTLSLWPRRRHTTVSSFTKTEPTTITASRKEWIIIMWVSVAVWIFASRRTHTRRSFSDSDGNLNGIERQRKFQ